MEPDLEKALDKVVAGSCFIANEPSTPKPEESKAPGSGSTTAALLELMGVEDDDSTDADED
jgi:hypothetical protein